jgi:hypothetical protein
VPEADLGAGGRRAVLGGRWQTPIAASRQAPVVLLSRSVNKCPGISRGWACMIGLHGYIVPCCVAEPSDASVGAMLPADKEGCEENVAKVACTRTRQWGWRGPPEVKSR